MNGIPYFKDYRISLANANDAAEFDLFGEWVSCYAAGEEFQLSLAGSPDLLFNSGLFISWPSAQSLRVRVTPKAGAAVFPNVVTLRVGIGDYKDNRFSTTAPLQIAAGAIIQPKAGAILTSPNADFVLVANTNTQIAAANANRKAVRVANQSATSTVRLSTDPAELTAGKGYLLGIGAEVALELNGLLYARSTGTPTLNVSELTY